jgi:exopolysaccharide biosynthesis polyprenyl glycosylphosphotransferase
MLYPNIRIVGTYLRSIDIAVIAGVAAGTLWEGSLQWGWPSGPPIIVFSASIALAFVALANRFRTYQGRRTQNFGEELRAISEPLVYAAGVACAVCQIFTAGLPGRCYAAAVAATVASLLITRALYRLVARRARRSGLDNRIWLIIGDNARTTRIAEDILAHPHFGIRIDEIVDLAAKPSGGGAAGRLSAYSRIPLQSRLLSSTGEVQDIISTRVIDEVIVTLPVRSYYDEIQQILDVCCSKGISVKLPPEAFERAGFRTVVSQLGGTHLVTHFSGPSNPRELRVKRALDIAVAGVSLVLLSPLLAVIAILVKLTSRGPVFFRQTRVGLHGRHFRMVKFRSMVDDAQARRHEVERLNQTDGAAFKVQHDPRITVLGQWLRQFHIDELPQLWNVLMGDMSLVGPRPLPPREARNSDQWRRRLSMPPGLTCYWQVKGDHQMPFRQWMQLDLEYIDGWSLWLDVKLLCSTLPTVVRGKGW